MDQKSYSEIYNSPHKGTLLEKEDSVNWLLNQNIDDEFLLSKSISRKFLLGSFRGCVLIFKSQYKDEICNSKYSIDWAINYSHDSRMLLVKAKKFKELSSTKEGKLLLFQNDIYDFFTWKESLYFFLRHMCTLDGTKILGNPTIPAEKFEGNHFEMKDAEVLAEIGKNRQRWQKYIPMSSDCLNKKDIESIFDAIVENKEKYFKFNDTNYTMEISSAPESEFVAETNIKRRISIDEIELSNRYMKHRSLTMNEFFYPSTTSRKLLDRNGHDNGYDEEGYLKNYTDGAVFGFPNRPVSIQHSVIVYLLFQKYPNFCNYAIKYRCFFEFFKVSDDDSWKFYKSDEQRKSLDLKAKRDSFYRIDYYASLPEEPKTAKLNTFLSRIFRKKS